MERAIALAKLGSGYVNPNPRVGAVIVKNNRIIGEGYHSAYGKLHAEREAIKALKCDAAEATIYVTLEPCAHYGKTPPCTQAIIENKIKKVVIGSRDPNPMVAGKGVSALRKAGIEVVEDFMREECDSLNHVFFHYIKTNTPYITLKYAMTLDGKIATKTGESKWISGESSRKYAHFLRHMNMGILAGIGTVLADNPMLNTRLDDKINKFLNLNTEHKYLRDYKNPVRIILDSNLRIPMESRIVRTAEECETIIVCLVNKNAEIKNKKIALEKSGVRVIEISALDGKIDLQSLSYILGNEGIDSILVEGGSCVNEAFLRAGLVNEICTFIAPKIFGGAAKSPVEGVGVNKPIEAYKFIKKDIKFFDEDIMIRYIRENLCLQG